MTRLWRRYGLAVYGAVLDMTARKLIQAFVRGQ